MTHEEWSRRRANLNHDYLRNALLTAIAAVGCVDEGAARRRLGAERDAWRLKLQRLVELLDEAESATSPAHLLEEEPLSALDDAHKGWLAPLLDELHRSTGGIQGWVARVRAQADVADGLLEQALANEATPVAQACDTLYVAVSALGDELGCLPPGAARS